MVRRDGWKVSNSSKMKKGDPVRVTNSSIKSFLNILLASPFVAPTVRVTHKTKINKAMVVQLSGEIIRRRRIKNITTFLFSLRSDGIKVTNNHPGSLGRNVKIRGSRPKRGFQIRFGGGMNKGSKPINIVSVIRDGDMEVRVVLIDDFEIDVAFPG